MQRILDKRERIVQAAIEVIGAEGFDAAAMADIAAKADVAKGTLYLYFDSKERLFEETYQICCAERTKACSAETQGLSSVMETLCFFLRNGTRWELAAPLKNRLLRAYLNHPVFSKNVPRVVEGLNTHIIEPILQKGIDVGELRPLPVELLEEMYIRFGSAVYYYVEKHPEEAENDALWTQLFSSLKGCLGAVNERG